MIGSVRSDIGRVEARTLAAIFSNYTRCPECRRSTLIRIHYEPGCPRASGPHFHRLCPCGHEWMERSAGHAPIDMKVGDPRFVVICQHCRRRMSDLEAGNPTCCQRPEVSYHDTREPCDLCDLEREPGAEG
jgi:hypothetical protein